MEGKRIDQERVVPTRCPECESLNFRVTLYRVAAVKGADDGGFTYSYETNRINVDCDGCKFEPAGGVLFSRLIKTVQ